LIDTTSSAAHSQRLQNLVFSFNKKEYKAMKIKILQLIPFLLIFFSLKGISQPGETIQAGAELKIRVFLQGALSSSNAPLMRDDLRVKGLIPATEPYQDMANFTHVGGGGETVTNPAVFQLEGKNAIVDWVFIQLRDPTDPKKVLATRSALLQRDGDVVDTDGISPLNFQSLPAGDYHVAVRHRNHLSVMTGMSVSLGKVPQFINFTDLNFLTYGQHAQAAAGSRMAMWGGNVNGDKWVIAKGPFNDAFYLFSKVMSDSNNVSNARNFIVTGYSREDINLDGKIIFEGPGNDHIYLLYKIVLPWTNGCVTCAISEQLP
jgi:hypothetical protein